MDYQTCVRTIRALVDGVGEFKAALARIDGGGIDAGGMDGPGMEGDGIEGDGVEAHDIDGSGFDWRAHADFLTGHRLVPFAAQALADPEVRRRFPADALADLDEWLDHGRLHTETLLAGTAEVREAFAREDIPFLCLKGLAYGERFYGDVHRRWQHDIDALVRSDDRPRALAALGRHGFLPHGPPAGRGSVRQAMRREKLVVDLHWNLRRRARRALPEATLWEATVPLQLRETPVATLSDEYTATFQAIAMCGDLRRGACNARQFLDLFMILRAVDGTLDWEAFFARRRAQALLKPCLNVFALLLGVWHVAPDLPRLARAVASRRRMLDPREPAEALALVQRPRDNPENPVWYRRVYPYSRKAEWARRLTVDLPHTLRRALRSGRGVPWPST